MSRKWILMTALALFAILGGIIFNFSRYPMINDYSSDLQTPPQFQTVAQLPENKDRDLSFPQENISIITKSEPDILFVEATSSPEVIFEKATELMKKEGWQIISTDPSKGTIEAVITTTFFRFKDDFILRLTNQTSQRRIDFRSKSRVGKGDLGANLLRIKQFKKSLEKALPLKN